MKSPPKADTATPREKSRAALLLWLAVLVCALGGVAYYFHGDRSATKETAALGLEGAGADSRPPATVSLVRPDRGLALATDSAASPLEQKVRAIQSEKSLKKREALLAEFVGQIATGDIEATLAALRELGPDSKEISLRLLSRWAENDLPAAARWSTQLPESQAPEDTSRSEALKKVAVAWADKDLNQAKEWAKQLPDADGRNAAMLALANETIRTEPVEALRLAVDLPADGARDQTIQHAAMEWALSDPLAARDWGMQVPDADLRNQILSAVATAWSESDPATAATMAAQELSGSAQADAVVAIVQRWAQKQPQAAAAWVAQFPDGKIKAAALKNLASLGVAAK